MSNKVLLNTTTLLVNFIAAPGASVIGITRQTTFWTEVFKVGLYLLYVDGSRMRF